jgi:hypothetical protein
MKTKIYFQGFQSPEVRKKNNNKSLYSLPASSQKYKKND